MRTITGIVVHCSASANGDARVTRDVIDGWHREKGWRKIGYHYVIETDGFVKAGRDLEEVGAHVEGSNARTVGICMVGTDRFSAEQWNSAAALVRELREKYRDATVMGHRDYSPDRDGDGVVEPWEFLKICPGFSVSDWIERGMGPMQEHLFQSVNNPPATGAMA